MNECIVDQIIQKNVELANFWSNSDGWAPAEAFELLTKSRLDWQVELSQTLRFWNFFLCLFFLIYFRLIFSFVTVNNAES